MTTPRKDTSMHRARVAIVTVAVVLAAGIAAPPLLSGDKQSPPVEWTVLPAAGRTFTPSPPGYACVGVGRGWLCVPREARP